MLRVKVESIMIHVTNTPNHVGVAVHGDCLDFDELYDALHEIVGGEDQYTSYEAARIRVLGVCYDIRHALMGDREIEFVDNGMNKDKMKVLALITPKKNIYLGIHVLWPEILFVTMSLNDFIVLHGKKYKHPQWNKAIATVQKFQAAVIECIKQTVTEISYKRMLNMMVPDHNRFDNYATQYIDILNDRFFSMNREKRLKNIPTMVKRIAEQGSEYQQVKNEILQEALKYNCSLDEIRYELEHPENIEW
jgi:hypothetical protein